MRGWETFGAQRLGHPDQVDLRVALWRPGGSDAER
jgi:hypothetical protein